MAPLPLPHPRPVACSEGEAGVGGRAGVSWRPTSVRGRELGGLGCSGSSFPYRIPNSAFSLFLSLFCPHTAPLSVTDFKNLPRNHCTDLMGFFHIAFY